ncbi:MAG: hypothetical protein JW896_01595, partial [Deltaproteobacteria bacterium]|nr:hypothetical protein [Deltaproteobacteria bacterium]
FFTPVDYYGAFSADSNWAEGWSLIDTMGVVTTGGSTDTCPEDGWANISGTVTYNSQPIVAMVLVNGQHMFTSGDNFGFYDLNRPVDDNCQITLQVFASGFAPVKVVLDAEAEMDYDVVMARADAGSKVMDVTYATEAGTDTPTWTRISGSVSSNGTPLVAMVLANGQRMFSNNATLGTGEYDLEVPLDGNGQITLQIFAAGFAPYKMVITP